MYLNYDLKPFNYSERNDIYFDDHQDSDVFKIKDNIIMLDSIKKDFNTIDNLIENNEGNIKVLEMIANQQKQIVLTMLGQNPEKSLVLCLWIVLLFMLKK